jgi:two-component system NarL family sensor kinase
MRDPEQMLERSLTLGAESMANRFLPRRGAWRVLMPDREAVRWYMIVRSVSGPALVAYALRSPGELHPAFWFVFAAGHVLVTVAVIAAFSSRWRALRPALTIPLDIAVLTALLALSGGAQSELRNMILALMIAPAIVMPPRIVAITGLGLLLGYLGVAAPDLVRHQQGAPGAVVSYVLGLLWATGTAIVLSGVRTRGAERVDALTRSRRLLLGAVLDGEARDRRAVTATLHEGALQQLLAARQDLDEAAEDPGAIAQAEARVRAAIAELRDTIAELHPVALDHGGLDAALRVITERAGERAGLASVVEVDAGAPSPHDDLIVNLVRELVSNVVEHARAAQLLVRVERHGSRMVLRVEDDGIGFEETQVTLDGMGLAACAERVGSADGTFAVDSAPGSGTRVRVELGPERASR